jgi:hypothetical protein
MKLLSLGLMMMTATLVQAKVYKCPGKVEGQYVYQQSSCIGAKVDEHVLSIIPSDASKIEAARKKMAKDTALNSDEKVEPREAVIMIRDPAAGSNVVPTSSPPQSTNASPPTASTNNPPPSPPATTATNVPQNPAPTVATPTPTATTNAAQPAASSSTPVVPSRK